MCRQIFLAATKSYIFISACTSCLSASSACLLSADKEGQTSGWHHQSWGMYFVSDIIYQQMYWWRFDHKDSEIIPQQKVWMMETWGLHSEPKQLPDGPADVRKVLLRVNLNELLLQIINLDLISNSSVWQQTVPSCFNTGSYRSAVCRASVTSVRWDAAQSLKILKDTQTVCSPAATWQQIHQYLLHHQTHSSFTPQDTRLCNSPSVTFNLYHPFVKCSEFIQRHTEMFLFLWWKYLLKFPECRNQSESQQEDYFLFVQNKWNVSLCI